MPYVVLMWFNAHLPDVSSHAVNAFAPLSDMSQEGVYCGEPSVGVSTVAEPSCADAWNWCSCRHRDNCQSFLFSVFCVSLSRCQAFVSGRKGVDPEVVVDTILI